MRKILSEIKGRETQFKALPEADREAVSWQLAVGILWVVCMLVCSYGEQLVDAGAGGKVLLEPRTRALQSPPAQHGWRHYSIGGGVGVVVHWRWGGCCCSLIFGLRHCSLHFAARTVTYLAFIAFIALIVHFIYMGLPAGARARTVVGWVLLFIDFWGSWGTFSSLGLAD